MHVKKNFSILLLLFGSFIYSEINDSKILLQYGVLHRSYKNDDFQSIESGASVYDNDEIRINVQFADSLACYIIYQDPEDNVILLYNSEESVDSDSTSLFFGTTGTQMFFPPSGEETIYLLLSKNPLNKLEKIIRDLNNSSGMRAKKFFKRFLLEIEKISKPQKKISNISARLDKPVVGGVSFRGDDDDITLYSLTHEAVGVDLILKTLTLNHLSLNKE